MTTWKWMALMAVCGMGATVGACSKTVHASAPTLHVVSGAIKEGETIPTDYTCDGVNVSPAIKWSNPPAATQSIAVVCDDPDSPTGVFTHWMIYNIPSSIHRLPEHVPGTTSLSSGARQGQNDFEHIGYGGPCPPPGPDHHYHFHVYALDARLNLPNYAVRADFDNAVTGHILAQGELVAIYGRPST